MYLETKTTTHTGGKEMTIKRLLKITEKVKKEVEGIRGHRIQEEKYSRLVLGELEETRKKFEPVIGLERTYLRKYKYNVGSKRFSRIITYLSVDRLKIVRETDHYYFDSYGCRYAKGELIAVLKTKKLSPIERTNLIKAINV